MQMITQTRPDMERRPRREADADNDATDMEAAPAAPTDLYDMLAAIVARTALSPPSNGWRCAASAFNVPIGHSML